MHILEKIDLVLRFVNRWSEQQWLTRNGPAYIVDRRKVHAIVQGVLLKLPVAVEDDLPICFVEGNCLGIAVSGLASPSAWRREPESKHWITHPSFMVAVR